MSEPLRVLRLAWPIMAAQVAVATTGVVDTAVMGRFGEAHDLAAVGVAASVIGILYWAFGFLRMATTGLTAQAIGAGERDEASAVLQRALVLGCLLGVVLTVSMPLMAPIAVQLFDAEPAVQSGAHGYLLARAVGAPAALMGFSIMGWLLGMGRTRELLLFQIVVNGANVVFDVVFVAGFDFGPAGIGLGTAIAEWIGLVVGMSLVREGLHQLRGVLDTERLLALFRANRDVLVRTLALLLGFMWFVRAGNRLGAEVAAGNEVLLQFITVSAFVLDAFAFVAEKEVGEAMGSRDRRRLLGAIAITTGWSLLAAILFSAAIYAVGAPVIRWAVADPAAEQIALTYLPYTAAVPVLGFWSWQLDGIFLGALRGAALRNGAVIASLCYVALDVQLRDWDNQGVWVAFLCFYLFRAATLAPALPGLVRDTHTAEAA